MAKSIRAARSAEQQQGLLQAVTEAATAASAPATPTAQPGDAGRSAAAATAQKPSEYSKGYTRLRDNCPVPDWFVDRDGKDPDNWHTKREREIHNQKSGEPAAKRQRPFGSGSHGNKRKGAK